MPREALSYGDRRLDVELDRLWAELRALKATQTALAPAESAAPVYTAPLTPPGDYVSSLAPTGGARMTGDVTLSAGQNVSLRQSGNDLQIGAYGMGLGVTFVELGDADDPYTLAVPDGPGAFNLKNTTGYRSVTVYPPEGHTFVENPTIGPGGGGAASSYRLPPGWSLGFYYPGAGLYWRTVWFWYPHASQTKAGLGWKADSGPGYIPAGVFPTHVGVNRGRRRAGMGT